MTERDSPDASDPRSPGVGSQKQQWLTLKEASDFLGVHFTTLRTWADKGDIPVFRTPGGHRRFSLGDLRRFLDDRAGQRSLTDAGMLVDAAVVRVRREIQRAPYHGMPWLHDLDEDARDRRRQRGRQLFSLAIAYVVRPGEQERILADGRRLGWEYGQEAALSDVSLAETGRAVQFFRSQLLQAVRREDGQGALDSGEVHIQSLLDRFLDEVLYAVLDGYEHQLGTAGQGTVGAALELSDRPTLEDGTE